MTETKTNGRSWGGAQTTTHEVYEEHTITQGEAFTSGQNWSTAWSVDSSHVADLTFDYTIQNTGTEYAREISGLIFNIYLGDDSTPIISYPAWEQFSGGILDNVFPGDTHTFSSNPVPLTLEQMKRIDLGERLTVVMEDFSYGADELFYQDAVNGGVTIYVEDGVADNDELVDMYVIPTWGVETVQDVLTRYFPSDVDDDGNINALWTPEFNGVNPPTWDEHFLSDIAWWNIYLTQSDAGNTPLHELAASPNSALLFRFNRDSDRDGYQDRVEDRYGTDKSDPASHPYPEVLAGYTATQDGDEVSVLLKLSNSGSFDAYGIDAVMYAPDDTVTIGNNTVGGNGRVRPDSQIAVGSLILAPDLNNWSTSTADPYATGNFSGNTDATITFTVSSPGTVGLGSTALDWTDGTTSDTLDLGSNYHAPLPITVTEGIYVGFDTGTLINGDSFTVDALTPRDTFTYTINTTPYSPPVIVVSYSDPQGSHRFVTPVELSGLDEDLTTYSGQMLPDVGVSIVTSDTVDTVNANITHFIINSPHAEPIENGHLYLNFISDGVLVAEMPYTMTLPTGPTVIPVQWSTDTFSQTYDAAADNILIAFWTDAQNNIIDSAARPLNTFQSDPTATASITPTTWDFGTLTQGETVQTQIAVANSGFTSLLDGVVISGDGLAATAVGNNTVFPATFHEIELTLDTTQLPTGAYAGTVTVRTNDIDAPQTVINVTGTIVPFVGDAMAYGVSEYRPWDQTVYISGTHNLNDTITFDHTIPDVPANTHPLYVYTEDETTLLGVGEYGPDFTGTTASSDMFGDGSDGDLVVGTGQTVYTDDVRTQLSNSVTAGQNAICVASTSGLQVDDEILIAQVQGTGIGNYEFSRIINISTCWLTLQDNLENTYTTPNSAAQVLRVPNYQNMLIENNGNLTAHAWNGSTGGIIAFKVNGTFTNNGTISANGKGFSGGWTGVLIDGSYSYSGEGSIGTPIKQQAANGNGGGGGKHKAGRSGGGGGGGHATNGVDGNETTEQNDNGFGGYSIGVADLSTAVFGGGGGGGGHSDGGNNGGSGGAGGGIILINALLVDNNGYITVNGGNGANSTIGTVDDAGGGGGGAGGSILIKGSNVNIGTSNLFASSGLGGISTGPGGRGGAGSVGRIRIEYCNSLTGTTNPLASTEQITCYIVRQLPSNPNTELILPEAVNGSARYHIQYGQYNNFAVASTQTYSVTLPKQTYDSLTVDALFQNLGNANFNFSLDIGDDGSVEWNGSGSEQPVIISSPNVAALASGLNTYLATTPAAWGDPVVIPIQVTLDTSSDLFLTNLSATPDISSDAEAGAMSFSDNTPTEGEIITIQAIVSNTASLPVSNIIAAFFAGDPTQDGVYLGADFVPEIQAGGTTIATLTWDTSNLAGDVDVYVILDLAEQITETNENNNQSVQVLTILSRPDLQAVSWNLSNPEPIAGEMVTITANLLNGGQTASGTAIHTLYSDNPNDSGILLDSQTDGGLGGNGSEAIAFSWQPSMPGPYQLFMRLDENDAVNEFDEANNLLWQDVYVGLAGPVLLDSGVTASDPAYSATLGYGYVDIGTPDVLLNCGGSDPEDTLRRDPDGSVNYRFNHLQPGHFYHLDITLYECDGAGRQENVLVDGHLLAGPEDLGDGEVHKLSLRLDPALYADRTIDVAITALGIDGAVVAAINLHDVDYRYADAGGNADPEHGNNSDYGWLDGVDNAAWGTLPYQSVRVDQSDDQVSYQFDNLDPAKRYNVLLTFWQGSGSARIQKVRIDGPETGLTIDSGDFMRHDEKIAVPLGSYASDGSIVVSTIRLNASSGAMINEIALEEETLASAATCQVQTTPFFSQVYGSVALAGTSAPPGTVVQAISPRGDIVGCFTVNNNGLYGFMRIYGEDSSANPPIPGMRAGELVSFKVSGSPAIATPLFYWQDDKASHPVDLNAAAMDGQFILLSPGWSWLSLNVEPPTPLVAQTFDSINGRYDRVLGENGIYDTSLPPVFNSLTEIHAGLGYMMRISDTASVNLLAEGVAIPTTTPIPLHQGWNWIGYLPAQTLPITVALQSITDQYQLVLGQYGTYDPALPDFSTLQEMGAGKGYMIYANTAVTLTYPASAQASNTLYTPKAITTVPQTPLFTIAYGEVRLNGMPAPTGTIIETVTTDGYVAGRFVVQTAGVMGFTSVYGADETAVSVISGFQPDEEIVWLVNGHTVESASPLFWQNDWATHAIELDLFGYWGYLPFIQTGAGK